MPHFTELEKSLTRNILNQDNAGHKMVGMLVKDILFKTGEAAFYGQHYPDSECFW